MRTVLTLVAVVLLMLGLNGAVNAANFTMSWDYKIFGNPNARQVALNLADKQATLEKAEQSEIDAFVEGLKRRLVSEVYRNIIDGLFDPDGTPGGGIYYAGNLIITVDHDGDGGTVVIIEDTVTGEVSIIELSDYWGPGV